MTRRELPFFLAFLLTWMFLASSVSAEDLFDQLAAQIQPVPVLRGDFTQERNLAGFSKPLRSSGQFVAARDHGVLWRTLQPFPSLLIITPEAIRERVDGQASFALDATAEPALRQINQILLALLQGELSALREHFVASGRVDAQGFDVRLTPQGKVADMLGSVVVAGHHQIERVQISERSGDSSVIEFSALQPSTLTDAELADFE